ncbi:hypothetical protein [Bacillus pumilus]|uniref:hypothetical protein n=1 Tax=Bacillus pumilus TaxID=1408 RepID=UPI00273F4BDB|nr:hypothetical protein [Bacillus pumilus]WLP59541.1 hypothetical protein Q8W18_18510 [Bacillus pumilus]
MYRILIFIASIILIVTGCSQNENMSMQRKIYNKDFVRTIHSYMKSESGGQVFEVNSQQEQLSELIHNTLVLYQKTHGHNSKPVECREGKNKFFCKVALSQSVNKSKFTEKDITGTDSYLNLFLLYDTFTKIKDSSGVKLVKETYSKLDKPSPQDKIEYDYYLILTSYFHHKKPSFLEKEIRSNLEQYTSLSLFDYDEPIILYASLILANMLKIEPNVKHLTKIYFNEDNQKTILFRDEITYLFHFQIVQLLQDMNHKKKSELTFNIPSNYKPFPSLFYSLDSLRNLYLMSNIFSSADLDQAEEFRKILTNRYEGLLEDKDQISSYQKQFFAKQITNELGLPFDETLIPSGTCQNIENSSEMYYCFKLKGEKADKSTLQWSDSDDLLTALMKYDIVDISQEDKNKLVDMFNEVISYQGDNYHIILNLYTDLLLNYNLDVPKVQIKEKIKASQCGLGYCTSKGSYDFELGVYGNNTLNLLEGVEMASELR